MTNSQPCGGAMQEKEILQDLLVSQKQTAGTYNLFAGECVSTQLRNTMLTILDDEHSMQNSLFQTMQSHGWYPTPMAPQDKINQARQRFQPQN